MKKFCFMAILIGHIWFLPDAISQVTAPQLLLTGAFHGDEVSARNGEKWLALVPSGNGYALEETQVRIKCVKDGFSTERVAETAKEVSIDSDKKPIFLVRGIQGIAPGKVETAITKPLVLEINRAIHLKLKNGRLYNLLLACDERAPKTVDNFKECSCIISNESKSQKIDNFQVYSPPGSEPIFASDAKPSLIWAGDLDRDGALDFVVDLSNHYNVSAPTLFLSSAAHNSDLVVKMAEFITYGC
jgi:hypothetical protein